MSYKMTRNEAEAFLAELHVGIVSVNGINRGPISVPVWYAYEPGGELRFCTGKNTYKVKLFQHFSRISMCVQDENRPYSYVSVEGPIVGIETCEPMRDLLPIAIRYMGEKEGRKYVEEKNQDLEDLLIHMRPERWYSANYGKPNSESE